MFVDVSVDGLPSKKDGSSFMWHNHGEILRLKALRSAVAASIGGRTDLPYAGPVSLRLTIWADPESGDLDNFVTGVCDPLMAAHPSTGLADGRWPRTSAPRAVLPDPRESATRSKFGLLGPGNDRPGRAVNSPSDAWASESAGPCATMAALRIGTWNMEGRRGAAQTALLADQDCEVWLLTEVNHRLKLPDGYRLAAVSSDMARDGQRAFKYWGAVATRVDSAARAAPHPASAAAVIAGSTFVSSILPWAASGGNPPWSGANHAERMANTLAALGPSLAGQPELVWGGDWNQALSGRETAGSMAGRQSLLALLNELGLSVPTAGLPHRIPELLAIDHIALATDVASVVRVVAATDNARLSDHDMYVIET